MVAKLVGLPDVCKKFCCFSGECIEPLPSMKLSFKISAILQNRNIVNRPLVDHLKILIIGSTPRNSHDW